MRKAATKKLLNSGLAVPTRSAHGALSQHSQGSREPLLDFKQEAPQCKEHSVSIVRA